jgi:hypothetical protein
VREVHKNACVCDHSFSIACTHVTILETMDHVLAGKQFFKTLDFHGSLTGWDE